MYVFHAEIENYCRESVDENAFRRIFLLSQDAFFTDSSLFCWQEAFDNFMEQCCNWHHHSLSNFHCRSLKGSFFLALELFISELDENLPTLQTASQRFIAGLLTGGYCKPRLHLNHPLRYAKDDLPSDGWTQNKLKAIIWKCRSWIIVAAFFLPTYL